MVAEAVEVASRNGIRWSEAEWPIIAAYCEIHDVPPWAGILVRQWENGGIVFSHGMNRIIQGIRATSVPTDQQAHQSARMLRRAIWYFILERRDVYERFREVHGTRAEPEALVRMYPTAFFDFFVDEVHKPRLHKDGMKKFLIEGFKKGDRS